jgi:hypothetical protein
VGDHTSGPDDEGAALRRAMTVLLSTIAAIPLLAGCGTDRSGGPDRAAATDGATSSRTRDGTARRMPSLASETPTTNDEAAGPPAFAENTNRQSGPGSGRSGLVLVDVAVAEAEGFDRIVLEFRGTGTPGWVVNYVDEAVLDGSGEVVALGGEAVLDIYASGTTWPAPDYYRGPRQLTPESGEINDVYVGGTFEGDTQVLAGIDGEPAPFRVFTLTAPSRLVIDVAHRNAD